MRTPTILVIALLVLCTGPALAEHRSCGLVPGAYFGSALVPTAYGYAPVYPAAPVYYPPYYHRRSRSNQALGAALTIGLVNEAFNRGSSRRDIRRFATGLALIGALSGSRRNRGYYPYGY